MAAPSVAPRVVGISKAPGIEMNIAHQLQQIGVAVAQDRFVAPLKQVADLAVAPIVALGVAGLCPLHDPGEGNFFGL